MSAQHHPLSFGLPLLEYPHLQNVSNANFLLNDVTAGATSIPLSGSGGMSRKF
jgi:hypothetical protein